MSYNYHKTTVFYLDLYEYSSKWNCNWAHELVFVNVTPSEPMTMLISTESTLST